MKRSERKEGRAYFYKIGREKEITWKRPGDFLDFAKGGHKDLVAVFSASVQASDINQGALGNCWFMCSMSAIAAVCVAA